MKKFLFNLPLFILFLMLTGFIVKISTFDKSASKVDNAVKTNPQEVKEIDYTRGETVFQKLKNRTCEELDLCWVAGGYAINGDKVLKKEFPTTWGSNKVIIIPNDEWINLSNTDKEELGKYLKHIGVDEIIAGRVKPAEFSDGTINPDRNVITVDERVWISNN